ncbi:MAG: cupredoxin domain-containing protein [Firmicutes bacterium]|nr:cupredoxin domain-containing protein [Bacillota bacterium]
MMENSRKSSTFWLIVFSISALFFTAAASPNCGGSKTNRSQVNITMIASIVQYRHGKLIGGWKPKKIIVKQGQIVHLTLESDAVLHQLSIPAYRIRVTIYPDKPAHVTFIAAKPGTFIFKCGDVDCGPLHHLMQGELIVEPAAPKSNVPKK